MSVIASLNENPLSDLEVDLVMPAYQVLRKVPAGTNAPEAIATVCRVLHEPRARIIRVLAYITKNLTTHEV